MWLKLVLFLTGFVFEVEARGIQFNHLHNKLLNNKHTISCISKNDRRNDIPFHIKDLNSKVMGLFAFKQHYYL